MATNAARSSRQKSSHTEGAVEGRRRLSGIALQKGCPTHRAVCDVWERSPKLISSPCKTPPLQVAPRAESKVDAAARLVRARAARAPSTDGRPQKKDSYRQKC